MARNIDKILFVTYLKNNDFNLNVCLLVSSIRTFAGRFSSCPIWVMIPKKYSEINVEMRNYLSSLEVHFAMYDIVEGMNELPLTELIFASATAEDLAKDSFDLLVWLDANTLIINEPNDFVLEEEKILGYRPVHHTLIGSIYSKPIDRFWKTLYKKFDISDNKLFSMETHIDGNTIRPYFNAGCIVTRPDKGILNTWRKKFLDFSYNEELEKFYKVDFLYKIFIHQAILTCTILTVVPKSQLYELPFEYNFPIHLYNEMSSVDKPKDFKNFKTVRYEEKKDINLLLSKLDKYYSLWFEKNQKILQNG